MAMQFVRKTTDMGWPEEGAEWWYTVLPEPVLSSELARLSFANAYGDTDAVTFQPCPNPEQSSQDRFVIKDWPLANGTWLFRAVFDGHAGHETADYTAATLPGRIKDALAAVLATCAEGSSPKPADVSEALTGAIAGLDASIGEALLRLFPDAKALEEMSDEQIRGVINDGGPHSAAVLRCMRGTTVLVTLVDPKKENIWVASLGDCAAVLGTRKADIEGEQWETQVLSTAHNGENPDEVDFVRAAHPNEPECVLYNRVLGAIAVTRGEYTIGDFSFKLPAVYTNRVFLNSNPGFLIRSKVEDYITRNFTPPYMSGTPTLAHVDLNARGASDAFLILCSDGLTDIDEELRLHLEDKLAPHWVNVVGKLYRPPPAGEDKSADTGASKKPNLALGLLRDGLGGTDVEKVSRHITVEMSMRWVDDTTVLVQRLL